MQQRFREVPNSLSGVSPGDHLCFFFDTAAERLAVLSSFIRQGLDRNERVACHFDPGGREPVLDALRKAGIDPAALLARGQLLCCGPGDSGVPEGGIDPERPDASLRAAAERAEADGYAGIRTAVDAGWILGPEAATRRMLAFETALGRGVRGQPPTSLCLFDTRLFPPAMLLKALSAHPKIVLGFHATENIYHLPPEELRKEDTAEQTWRCWIKNLREHRLTHEALQESERNYALLFNKMLNGFALMEAVCDESGAPIDLRYLEVNPAFERQTGSPASAVLGKTLGELGAIEVAPDDTRAWIRLIGGVAISGRPIRYEKSGESLGRWIEGFAFSPRYGQVAIMFQDVTDRKKVERELERYRVMLEEMVAERTSELESSLREKEVLLREIHHRVKNNLQVIASLLSLQADALSDPAAAAALAESRNRINTIGLVHEKLYRAENLARIDLGDYVRNLFLSLLQTYGVDSGRIRLETDIPPASLDIGAAIPWALILNELLVNALKHAWPDSESGTISVAMGREGGRWRLRVSDDGRGLPDGFDLGAVGSLGLRIVRLLSEQLGGSVRAASAGGAELTIEFPDAGADPAPPEKEAAGWAKPGS